MTVTSIVELKIMIILRSDLQKQLEINAQQRSKSINDLVNEAVERYLDEQRQHKLDRELTAYETLHHHLQQTHFGKWVAIHQGELVDSDSDGPTLYRRVRAEYGRISVLIRQVKDHPTEEVWLRTPKIRRHSL